MHSDPSPVPSPVPSPGALRMRRYRERRRREIVLVRLPMLAAGIEAMISTGWLARGRRPHVRAREASRHEATDERYCDAAGPSAAF